MINIYNIHIYIYHLVSSYIIQSVPTSHPIAWDPGPSPPRQRQATGAAVAWQCAGGAAAHVAWGWATLRPLARRTPMGLFTIGTSSFLSEFPR